MDWSILSKIAGIVLIDLVLSGDNALVIGMAARDLPNRQRRWAIIWGTVAAIVLRVAFTVLVAFLLFNFPGLRLGGGLLLVWIAIKLLTKPPTAEDVDVGRSLWEAIRIIVVADVVMSLDNVLAVAGASHGDLALLIFGLALSIPLLMGGATLVAYLMNRLTWLIWLGGAVLAWVAGEMIVNDPLVDERLETVWPGLQQLISLHLLIPLLITLGVTLVSYILGRRRSRIRVGTEY